MCGRAAQSLHTVQYAARELFHTPPCEIIKGATSPSVATTAIDDNFNLAPGHSTVIFHASVNTRPTEADTRLDSQTPSPHHPDGHHYFLTSSISTWGLCPLDGTRNDPLPEGPSKHFSNLMFNARSDTLYSKKTFSPLALRGQTCIWAVDGYFEWKEDEGDVLTKGGGGKQPYFVTSGKGVPLLIPGLWNKVKTGRLLSMEEDGSRKEEYLETFTILTTESCPRLKWIHSRQPLLLFDVELARRWLVSPSESLLEEMVQHSAMMGTDSTEQDPNWIQWYPVTKQMSKIGYVGKDCIQPIKIEKVQSVKSFFTKNVPKRVPITQHSLEGSHECGGNDNHVTSITGTAPLQRKRIKVDDASVASPMGTTTSPSMAQNPCEIQQDDNNRNSRTNHNKNRNNSSSNNVNVGIEKFLVVQNQSKSHPPPSVTKKKEGIKQRLKKEGPLDAFFVKHVKK